VTTQETRDPGSLSRLLEELAEVPRPDLPAAYAAGLRPGTELGRFIIEREIGRGGFGVVYEAHDPELGRAVALKTLRRGRSRRELSEDWIRQEAEAVAHLDHPSIVTVFDVGTCPAGPYLVEELLHGETLAERLAKPVLLHNRDSEEDLLAILESAAKGRAERPRGVFHSFCASTATGERAIALGYLVSYSGMITFRMAENVRESAAALPLEAMLVETDAPYLAPAPFRGKPNEPAYVRWTAEKLAEVKGVPLAEVAAATTASFRRLFGTP
jgi:hypothetical protein